MDTVRRMTDTINAYLPASSRIDLTEAPKVRLGMSAIQITAFVLNDKEFPTDFAKAHQAKFEIWNRLVDLMRYVFDSRKRAIKAAILERDLDMETDPLKRQLIEVRIAEHEFSRSVSEQWAMERSREIMVFWDVYLRHKAGDPDDPEDLQRLELETWQTRMEIEPRVFAERHLLDPARIAAVVREYFPTQPAIGGGEDDPPGVEANSQIRLRWFDPQAALRGARERE